MKLKFIQDEDFTNYKKCAMFIGFPYCTFKCELESGIQCCQNSALARQPSKDISLSVILKKYLENLFTSAIVLGGLEPFESWADLQELVRGLREFTNDDIVIYTGFLESELVDQLQWLKQYPNIIVKFGRFIPDQESHYDETLGVSLASKNQYAKKIS